MKPLPFTVSVKPAEPALALDGESEEIRGVGLLPGPLEITVSPLVPHCLLTGLPGLLLGMIYQVPVEGRNTARSVIPSPS